MSSAIRGLTMANEMRGYPDHGWRADEYTLIRGDLHAAVSRSWCADTECSTGWRWSLYRILDPLEQIDPPVDVTTSATASARRATR
jgi:hypothetical protein